MPFPKNEVQLNDWLGRRDKSKSEWRKARNNSTGKGSPNTFDLSEGEVEMSVDRLCRDENEEPFCSKELDGIAERECAKIGRTLRGWLALTRSAIEEKKGLRVRKSCTRENPYHADVTGKPEVLHSDELRDDLARKARVVQRFAKDVK